MKSHPLRHMVARPHVIGWALVSLFAVLIATPRINAAEPARAFLNALREAQYYEMAIEYLDRMEKSPLAPVELKETIQYERGVTLLEGASFQRDFAIREKQLDEAQTHLDGFLKTRQGHPLVDAAQSKLGNLLEKRATMKVERARTPQGRGEKTVLLKDARGLYEQAYKVFTDSQGKLKAKLEQYPKVMDPKTQSAEIARRDELRKDYLQAQLLAAVIKEEMADTAEEGSAEHTKLLTEAGAEFGEIYKKYRVRLAGLYARMYQGRCHQKMGKLVDALSYYGELLEQPDSPDAFRDLKTKVLQLAMDCWLDESQGKYAVAVATCSEWVAKARPNENQSEDWSKLRLQLAKAHKLFSEYLKKEDPKDKQIGVSLKEAKKWAEFVARYPGELQKPAKEFLADLGVGGMDDDGEKPDPKNFTEAKVAGKEALDSLQAANLVLQRVPPRIAAEKDPGIKAELQKQLDDAKEILATARTDALYYYDLALQFIDEETSLDDINVVRYFLCYLYYVEGNYFDAAVMGEFLAKRYPDSSGARQSAKITMASYLQIYAANKEPEKDFEVAHIVGIADFIIKKWPDQPEATEARNTLIPFMIKNGDLDKAMEYVLGIPEDSDKRGAAELKTGQAMWSAYLSGSREVREWEDGGTVPDGVDLAAKKTQLQELKSRSQVTLADGIKRMKGKGSIDTTMATAALSLIQIYVDTEQADKAVALLEEPSIGIIELTRKKHDATQGEGFAQETFKTALRAYISASQSDPKAIEKAKQVMKDLQATVGSTPEGQKRLIAIYISLARDLKKMIELLDSAQAKTNLTKGFEAFLKEVSAASSELNELNWVAETFAGMGEALSTKGNTPPEAKRYYDLSIAAYQKILDMDSKLKLEPAMKTQLKMRMAMTLRQTNQYKAAMDLFEEILVESNMMLNVQVEAAKTYQMWAQFPGKEGLYEYAMKGAKPDKTKKNTIWGWIRLSQITGRYPQYKDVFHEARYNLAVCHYEFGMKNRAKKDTHSKYMKYAKNDILMTQKLYGEDMGGPKWEPQYDQLLRMIQRELKETASGLPKPEVQPTSTPSKKS